MVGAVNDFQGFLDSTPITVTINQNSSQVDFTLDTTGAYFDHQNIDIKYETITGIEFDISKLLGDINGQVGVERDSDIIQFDELNMGDLADIKIKIGTSTISAGLRSLLGIIFGFNGISLDLTNMTAVNEYLALSQNHLPVASDRHVVFTKDGTDYTIWNDEGYGNIPNEWKIEIINVINESVQQINIQSILENFLPMLESEPEFQAIWDELNLNFTVTEVDLSSLNLDVEFSNLSEVQLEDGNYTIPVTVSDGITNYTKNVNLIIEGIQNRETNVPVTGNYTPTNPEVSRYLIGISGLGVNTVNVSLFDVFSSNLPSNTKTVLKYMEITVTTQTDGTIKFKVPTSSVLNPSLVGLYVLEGSNWVGLSITSLGEVTPGFYHYSATTPHFSTFMIMETLPLTTSSGGGGGSSRSNYYRYSSASNSCITIRETASEASRNGDFSTLGACQSQITTITTPTNIPEPIEATPAAPRVGGGITGAFIGALTSPTGLVVLIAVLIGIVIVVLVIRNIPGRKGKKGKKLNEEGDKDEV